MRGGVGFWRLCRRCSVAWILANESGVGFEEVAFQDSGPGSGALDLQDNSGAGAGVWDVWAGDVMVMMVVGRRMPIMTVLLLPLLLQPLPSLPLLLLLKVGCVAYPSSKYRHLTIVAMGCRHQRVI